MESPFTKLEDEKTATKQKILKIAAELFYKNGYDNTTTRELAKEVGLSNAGIYYHFQEKNDLLYQIINESTRELHQSVIDAIKQEDDPINNLNRIISIIVKIAVESRMEIGILLKESNRLSPQELEGINKKMKEVVDLVKHELAKLQNRGLLQESNITVSAFALMGITNWVFYWFDQNGSMDIQELTEILAGIFFKGVLKSP